MNQLFINTILFAVITSSITFLAHTQPSRIEKIKKDFDPYAPPPLALLPSSLINILTLGHKHIYDDFSSIWLLQTLMEKQRPENIEKLSKLVDTILAHRPSLETNYLLSCVVFFQDLQAPEKCQAITLKGLEVFPQSWRIPMLQGYIHAVQLNQPVQAAAFFKLAASKPGKPQWVDKLANKLFESNQLSPEEWELSIKNIVQQGDSTKFQQLLENYSQPQTSPKMITPATGHPDE